MSHPYHDPNADPEQGALNAALNPGWEGFDDPYAVDKANAQQQAQAQQPAQNASAQGGAGGAVSRPTDVTLQGMGGGSAQVQPRGAMNSMQGFDQRNWDDPNMDSVKYAHGRLANGVTRPSDMGRLVQGAEYQRRFPGATFDGKDKVNFMGAAADGARGGVGVGIIDVLTAADKDLDTSTGGWWGWDQGGAETHGGPQNMNSVLQPQGDPLSRQLAGQQRPPQPSMIEEIMKFLAAQQTPNARAVRGI